MVKVLFVCMGNICRSPAAEGAMNYLIEKHNLQNEMYCESAGTSAYHVGDSPDARMVAHAKKRGFNLESTARQFEYEDFEKFNFIVTMDRSNYNNVIRLDPEGMFKEKVIPMAHLCHESSIIEVPDPYYEGPEGFEQVLDIVEDGALGLLLRLGLVP